MKKALLTLVLAVGMTGISNAQLVKEFCMQDVFGYSASVTASQAGVGLWNLSGWADVGLGTDWSVSGYMEKFSDIFYMSMWNPAPDECATYVDYFAYTSTSHSGGTIYFDWTSYCLPDAVASGTGSTDFSPGLCAFRMAETTPSGPVIAGDVPFAAAIGFNANKSGLTLAEFLAEPEFSVIRNDADQFTIGYELTTDAVVSIDIYNHVGQHIATIVNSNESKGIHIATWNSADVAPGMYVAVMNTNGISMSNKFMK